MSNLQIAHIKGLRKSLLMHKPTQVRESRPQAIARLAGSIGFVVLGAWLIYKTHTQTLPDSRELMGEIGGWSGVLFFGPVALRFALASVKPGKLTLSEAGLEEDLSWRIRKWKWSEIQGAAVIKRTASVCELTLFNGKRVQLFGWELDAERLLNLIESFQTKEKDRS